ncbi:hypothetical protein [Oricola thermophila]|uniref:Uncharacterized protein n=1 Tax=Oricola thermophila TaxID=2742145 RepID=A0A6N1VAZ7_9HYPH|nr:hypothetical protein [Oricola thermophila]QKV17828.1 hypothetical protein HTY61_04825 [Oricola thermophila]
MTQAETKTAYKSDDYGLDWRDVKSAPKDGRWVWMRNEMMDFPVVAAWGKYRHHSLPGEYEHFGVVIDPFEKWMPLPCGAMICGTQWAPYDAEKHANLTWRFAS